MTIIRDIVSLAPSSTGSTLNVPLWFVIEAPAGALGRNFFSLRLQKPQRTMFSNVNRSLFTDKVTQIPVINETSPYGLTGC
jgi:hypothetical protein